MQAKGSSQLNEEPRPSVVSTWTVPPICSASFFEMARPKPVPPWRRAAEESTWLNSSKSWESLWAGMPMPVSSTRIRNRRDSGWLAQASTAMRTQPASVNLMALPARFSRIWRTRPPSPITNLGRDEG